MNNSVSNSFYIFLGVFIISISIEMIYTIRKKLNLYNLKDSLINLMFGFLGVINRALTKGLWFALWSYLYQFAPIQLPETLTTYVLLFIMNELVYYWFHRLSHEQRLLWAVHVNHHSSEYLNFTTAARIPFFNLILHNLFWIPLLFLGFNPMMIFAVETIGFLFAFIQHSQMIKNFGFLDLVLNSPAHHRIHHASNAEYLNKNYGNVLIIFDRIFGTFQNEIKDVNIKYGLTKNVKSYNPFKLIFHEWLDIFKSNKGRA